MSAGKNQQSNMPDTDFSALDMELAQMAEETPEVPEDFHARWTGAVREEASARKPAENAPDRAPEKGKPAARRQIRYLLSAAAAFVVLIGGVIIAGDQIGRHNGEQKGSAPAEIPAVTASVSGKTANSLSAEAAGEPETGEAADIPDTDTEYETEEYSAAAEAPAYTEDLRAEGTYMDTGYSMAAYAGSAIYADADSVTGEAAPAGSAAESAPAPAAGMAMKAEAYPDEAAEMEEAYEATPLTAEYTEDRAAAAEEPVPAATAIPVPAATGAPTPEITEAPTINPTDVPAAEPAAAPDPEETEDEMEAHSFLQDTWSFLLSIAPWVLGVTIVILFIAAYVVNIEKRRERKNQ